jgi:hypothetical protein
MVSRLGADKLLQGSAGTVCAHASSVTASVLFRPGIRAPMQPDAIVETVSLSVSDAAEYPRRRTGSKRHAARTKLSNWHSGLDVTDLGQDGVGG